LVNAGLDAPLAELVPSVSSALGEAWANEVANKLREQLRAVAGGWPGTLREARSRTLIGCPIARHPTFDPEALAALTRAVYEAARRRWDAMAEPDPEP
jgi:hypothetical protein